MIESSWILNLEPTLVGYAAVAVAYAVLSVLVMTIWRDRFEGCYLEAGAMLTAAWGGMLAWSSYTPTASGGLILAAEMASDGAWLLFLSSLLSGAVMSHRVAITRYAGVALAAFVLLLGLAAESSAALRGLGLQPGRVLVLGSILTSLYALVAIEQIHRNARETQRNDLKFLCLGLAAVFGIDLFLYSNAVFIGQVGATLWESRGFLVAMCAPVIALSVHRRDQRVPGVFFSRQVVFYSATLVAAGLYLTFVGVAGYLVQNFGIRWSSALEAILLTGAGLFGIMLLTSQRLRSTMRVVIAKHFFESRYDYREEWLKLIGTLTASDDALPLRKRAIQAIAQIVGSRAGVLWLLADGDGGYEPVAAWNMAPVEKSFARGDSLVRFLSESGWVVDLEDVVAAPQKFAIDDPVAVLDAVDGLSIVVPMFSDETLFGFIAVNAPPGHEPLNFEDHDLLKTAGKQVAGFLAQEAATDRLTESRQFEAYNRLTAYVMHDLKNAIAQQTLVVENAARHKRNPEFVDDAMETIRASVTRMRKVVSQLQQGVREEHADRVDVGKVILQSISQCEDREPIPIARLCDERLFVRADSERFLMALCHAIRNAQDATAAKGAIEIALTRQGDRCEVRISDTGKGMDAAFVRERLFRPFDSTKGTQGMGIGAHQIRETIRAAGGSVRIESAPGIGTTLFFKLPLHDG